MEHTRKKRKSSEVDPFTMITGVVKGTLVLTPQPPDLGGLNALLTSEIGQFEQTLASPDLGGLKAAPIPKVQRTDQPPLPPEVGEIEGGLITCTISKYVENNAYRVPA